MNTMKNKDKINKNKIDQDQNKIEKGEEIQEQVIEGFLKYTTNEVVEQIMEDIDDLKQYEFEPSDNFMGNMEKMFTKAEKEEATEKRKEAFKNRYKKFTKRVAGVIVFCFVAFAVRNVEAFKVPIFNFFVEVHDKFSRVNLQKEGEDVEYNLEHIYKEYQGIALPVEVPKGYRYVETIGKDGVYKTIYKKSTTEQITISQFTGIESVVMDTETKNGEIIEYNSKSYTIKEGDNKLTIVWQETGNSFHICGNITKDQALRLADSMCFAIK